MLHVSRDGVHGDTDLVAVVQQQLFLPALLGRLSIAGARRFCRQRAGSGDDESRGANQKSGDGEWAFERR